MKSAAGLVAAAFALLAGSASGTLFRNSAVKLGPIDAEILDAGNGTNGSNGTSGWGTFPQLIDHANPALGTFPQRYWYGAQFWNGSGSPIILNTPGEQAADGFNKTYLTEKRLTGLFAEAVGGAVIVLEHRYWGESSPFDTLTVENLQYLTLENAIKDLTYFARNFLPPFDPSGGSSPQNAPWIFSGGSYPGALAGWIERIDPGTFWAYHGTSGVVQAVGDFWSYFQPVYEATPKNCSTDLNLVINHIDKILLHGSDNEKCELKSKFQLEGLEDADFASALENGPWTWQETQFYSVTQDGFTPYYQFCDYIEHSWNTTDPVPGPEGVGLEKALEGYVNWWLDVLLPDFCSSYGYEEWNSSFATGCFAGLNATNPLYTDLSVGNAGNRQWNWLVCNEPLEFWQDGPPADQPALVSRLVNVEYWKAQCALFFPEVAGGFGLAKNKSAAMVNAWTGGWDVTNTTRLMYTNGQLDPWREATVSAESRPGGPLKSTEQRPVRVIEGGIHCSDYYQQNWKVNDQLYALVLDQVANLKTWVDEFYAQKNETSWRRNAMR